MTQEVHHLGGSGGMPPPLSLPSFQEIFNLVVSQAV